MSAGPEFTIDATMPKAYLVLYDYAQNIDRAGAPQNKVQFTERIAEKMRDWDGTGDPPKWKVLCDMWGRDALAHYASRLELGMWNLNPDDHVELIGRVKQAARAMKQYMQDGKFRPPADALPASLARADSPKMLPTLVPVAIVLSVGAESFTVTFPDDAYSRDLTMYWLADLIHVVSAFSTTAAESERWITGPDGSPQLVRNDNPHHANLKASLARILSKLRAIGALADGGSIDERDRPGFTAFMKDITEPANA